MIASIFELSFRGQQASCESTINSTRPEFLVVCEVFGCDQVLRSLRVTVSSQNRKLRVGSPPEVFIAFNSLSRTCCTTIVCVRSSYTPQSLRVDHRTVAVRLVPRSRDPLGSS